MQLVSNRCIEAWWLGANNPKTSESSDYRNDIRIPLVFLGSGSPWDDSTMYLMSVY